MYFITGKSQHAKETYHTHREVLSHRGFVAKGFVVGRFCHKGFVIGTFCSGGFCDKGFCHSGFLLRAGFVIRVLS